jgi:hypothetical protein
MTRQVDHMNTIEYRNTITVWNGRLPGPVNTRQYQDLF